MTGGNKAWEANGIGDMAATMADECPRSRRTALIGVAAAMLLTALLAFALVLTYTTLSNRLEDANSLLAKTQGDLAATNATLAQTQAKLDETGSTEIGGIKERLETMSTNLMSMKGELTRAEKRIALYGNCFPEVQAQINGIGVNTYDQNGWLTGAYITNSVQVSRVCQPLLFPNPSGFDD